MQTGSSSTADTSSGKGCFNCKKTTAPQEEVKVDEFKIFHKSCFKCSRGNHDLSPNDWSMFCGRWYCNEHLNELMGQGPEKNKHLFKYPPRLITKEADEDEAQRKN